MPTIFARILLFLSSFLPLFIIFFMLYMKKNIIIATVALTLGVVGFIGLWIWLQIAQGMNPLQVTVTDVKRTDSEVMSYIVSYIIPFMATAFSDNTNESLALLVFFLMIAVIYVNSSLIHVNPILNLMGYRLYEITTESGSTFSLLTKKRVSKGKVLRVVPTGEDMMIERP